MLCTLFLQMPQRRTPKKKNYCYSDECITDALTDIKSGLSIRKASEKYEIPRSTLSDKMLMKVPLNVERPGPSGNLSKEQEEILVNYLITMAKIGYGVPRKDVPIIVKEILDKGEAAGHIIPENKKFKNNMPSLQWVYNFFRRHSEISARVPENLGFLRARITETAIREWFAQLTSFLRDEHGIDVEDLLNIENAGRVFNMDESGFPLEGSANKMKVITQKGVKNVHRLTTETKEQITVLACVNAKGDFAKPMVIFPGKKAPRFNFEGVNPDDFDVGFTPNG